MCADFKGGTGNAHQLVNRTMADVLYLEVGDRSSGDAVVYRHVDLQGVFASLNGSSLAKMIALLIHLTARYWRSHAIRVNHS